MIPKEQAHETIGELVDRFGDQLTSYKKAEYNETLVRRDFIDPFFKALGWDVDNSQGYAKAYREVIHEDRVRPKHITYSDNKINKLVYQLYGLSDEEVGKEFGRI